MSLPFFYDPHPLGTGQEQVLSEEVSRHIVSVLRMKAGEQLLITDGNGGRATAEIVDDHKKHCRVRVLGEERIDRDPAVITLAVSLTKNNDRFEWLVEKACEIGVTGIIPLICARTSKGKFRYDRMHAICISAMLQSQQVWLTHLSQPVAFPEIVTREHPTRKFIAHCADPSTRRSLKSFEPFDAPLLLIGPEGDFTPEEILLAESHGFTPVSLGANRLRTETAAIVGATLLKLG